MTVNLTNRAIVLAGPCGVEEVETLISHLQEQPDLPVEISEATTVHTALWQALMVFRPKITGAPTSSFIAQQVLPGLNVYFTQSEGS
ncbi:hypothetical protein ACQKKX_06920 [Neorhizobium sp. NPDC001467]|uniref:hypothetical protein n=1 Tax=Neorhizobium sp. NPDC001467 TaxID=3390595 RepID=UPI003CFF5752